MYVRYYMYQGVGKVGFNRGIEGLCGSRGLLREIACPFLTSDLLK